MVADVYSVIMAGPWIRSPGAESFTPVEVRLHEPTGKDDVPHCVEGGGTISGYGGSIWGRIWLGCCHDAHAKVYDFDRFVYVTDAIALLMELMEGCEG